MLARGTHEELLAAPGYAPWCAPTPRRRWRRGGRRGDDGRRAPGGGRLRDPPSWPADDARVPPRPAGDLRARPDRDGRPRRRPHRRPAGHRPRTAGGAPDLGRITWLILGCAVIVLITAAAVFRMNVRLFRTTETALAGAAGARFRHVHDLSVLHQQGERRGSLVSRVTSDVDQLSVFMQWGGVLGLVSVGQLVVATVVMAFYSWQLTLLVLACFIPLAIAVRWFAKRLAAAYGIVRERVGDVLGAIAESVVGAPTVRAYGVRARTATRIDAAIDRHYRASVNAQKVTAAVFVTGEFVASLANAAVIVVGVLLGLAGDITAGTLIAFLFLVTLFVAPVQTASEVLNEAQNAVAGFRRVLDVIDTEPDIRDPAIADPEHVRELPAGPLGRPVRTRLLPLRPGRAAGAGRHRPHHRAAAAGRDRGRDRLGQDHLRQAGHPADGPGRRLACSSVGRRRLGAAARGGVRLAALAGGDGSAGRLPVRRDRGRQRPVRAAGHDRRADRGRVRGARPRHWVEGLEDGVATAVGQRGESLSAGERQLVAVARAYVADPDLLVLDEATSAVDPATEAAADAGAGHPHERAHHADHRAPALHRRAGRRDPRRRRRARRPARHARRTRGRRGPLPRSARVVAPVLGGGAGPGPLRPTSPGAVLLVGRA